MLDIKRRKGFPFITVHELISELGKLPQDAMVTICGDGNVWLHVEGNGSYVCIDNEDLDEAYLRGL